MCFITFGVFAEESTLNSCRASPESFPADSRGMETVDSTGSCLKSAKLQSP